MLAVGGRSLWLMSTPNVKTGFFYREWASDRPWLRIQATAEECPRIPADFLKEERATLGDQVFRQEYLCEFLVGEGYLFDEAVIRACITDKFQPLALW